MTDQELRLALAKMLPERIDYLRKFKIGGTHIFWIQDSSDILETEWLYVCHLIEQTLAGGPGTYQPGGSGHYSQLLECRLGTEGKAFATWQQRAEALIKTKGIKP